MQNDIKELKRLAREAELEVLQYPNGRLLVVGGLINVHWWPGSKHRTAYAEGSPKGIKYANAQRVINIAIKGTP